jgi:peptide/nickel transport system substrate-binding protein
MASTRFSFTRGRRLAALMLACALAVTACSGQSPSASEHSSTRASAVASTGEGGTLSIAFLSDIQTLDPAQGYDVVSWPAEQLMFETLVGYDDQANVVPVLAESLPEISSDGRTYTFTLREGVSFVNGQGDVVGEMTADDVVASLNRILNPTLLPNPSPMSGAFWLMIDGAQDVVDGSADGASGIVKVDDRTVEITIAEPNATFLNVLAMPFGSVLPADTPADADQVTANPIGTGPFVLQSYASGQQAVFVRNPHYWNPLRQHVDRIEFRVGVDPTSALQQVQTNDLDIMGDNPPAGSINSLLDDQSLAGRVFRTPQVATQFLAMDTSGDGPTSNLMVRQAISRAIDRDNIVAIAHLGVAATCILPPTMPGYDPACDPYPYDPDAARQLLADAGYADGFDTTLYTDTNDPDPAVAQAIQQDLAAVGITVEVVSQAFDTLLGTIVVPHQAPLIYIGWIQDFPDPSDFYDPILSCATNVEGNFNLAWWCNEEVDRLADQARVEQDPVARISMYKDLFDRVMDDAPWVPILYPEQLTVVSDRVQGFFHHPAWIFDIASYGVSS